MPFPSWPYPQSKEVEESKEWQVKSRRDPWELPLKHEGPIEARKKMLGVVGNFCLAGMF
jgi:hypothetical protein